MCNERLRRLNLVRMSDSITELAFMYASHGGSGHKKVSPSHPVPPQARQKHDVFSNNNVTFTMVTKIVIHKFTRPTSGV